MKKMLALLLLPVLLLAGCAEKTPAPAPEGFRVAAATYPTYLLASALAAGVEGVTVTAVVNQPMSCLHDYTLSVSDLQTVEGASLLVVSGQGLEAFLSDLTAAYPDLPVADASAGVAALLPGEAPGESDPHHWLDPARFAQAMAAVCETLAQRDPDHAEAYRANLAAAQERLAALKTELTDSLAGLSCRELVTFHDGFAYFADAFDLTILRAIEEESGSEASAKEIAEIAALVKERGLPAIFCEVNGSTATAEAIARETGVKIGALTTLMSGERTPEDPLGVYADALRANAAALLEAMG